jgi:hypothetical protein
VVVGRTDIIVGDLLTFLHYYKLLSPPEKAQQQAKNTQINNI